MELLRNILLLLHLAGMAGILISLIKTRTKIATGLVHSALLATVAGIALVGIRYPLHSSDPMKWPLPDNLKITIKLIFVLIILALAFVNFSALVGVGLESGEGVLVKADSKGKIRVLGYSPKP